MYMTYDGTTYYDRVYIRNAIYSDSLLQFLGLEEMLYKQLIQKHN